MSQPFLGTKQRRLDMVHLKTIHVFPLDAFEQIPDPFVRIQCWRRARQTFEMQTCGSSFCHRIVDGLTAMNRGTVPHDQHVARDLSREHLHKAHDIWACGRMVLGLQKALPLWSDAAQSRKMVTGPLTRTVGVCPRGADVRTAIGNTEKAD